MYLEHLGETGLDVERGDLRNLGGVGETGSLGGDQVGGGSEGHVVYYGRVGWVEELWEGRVKNKEKNEKRKSGKKKENEALK